MNLEKYRVRVLILISFMMYILFPVKKKDAVIQQKEDEKEFAYLKPLVKAIGDSSRNFSEKTLETSK